MLQALYFYSTQRNIRTYYSNIDNIGKKLINWQLANQLYPKQNMFGDNILSIHTHIYVPANLWNQIFPGIPDPLREFGESLKLISSKSNLTDPNLT